VFELRELETATYTAGRIVWKDNAFEEQWRIPKKQPVAWKPESREWLIGEIVTCLYVRLGRYRRGEQRHPEWPAHLSRFLAGYDRVVESAQEMLAYLDENYTVQPEIKRVITQLSTTARSELF
jgi:lincosamide nucleotidyltransferase